MLPGKAPDLGRPAEPAARALKSTAALALAAGLIAGCGEGGGTTTSTSTSSTAGAGRGGTELVVTVNPGGKGGEPAQQQVVSCPGPDKAACQAIADLPPDAAAEVPPGSPCTQIYGGPDTVVLQGTLNGEPVDARLSRGDGCEIERFDRFVPMLKVLFPDYEPGL